MIRTTVRELGRVVTGHTPPTTKHEYYGDDYLFLKPTDMVIGQKYTYSTEEGYSALAAEKYKSSIIPKGSTCVVCIGTLGEKMSMTQCDLFTNQSINSIIPYERYNPHYVYYLLKHNLHKVKALNKGTASGREFVSKSTFLDLEIDVIEDLIIQKKIADILSAYDDLIENNQRQIKLLEEAAQRLYKEWFVDLHFPGYENVQIIDGVPEGWKKKCIGDLCVKTKSTVAPEDVFAGTPYIGLEHIPRHDFCLSVWGDVSDVNSAKALYKKNDIIFGQIRPYFHKVGFAINEGVASTDSFIMTPQKEIWGLFLLTVSSDAFVKYTSQTCKEGAKMPRADWDQMKNYPVLIADSKTQLAFERTIHCITEIVRALAMQNRALSEARDRLLPKLMSGEIEL